MLPVKRKVGTTPTKKLLRAVMIVDGNQSRLLQQDFRKSADPGLAVWKGRSPCFIVFQPNTLTNSRGEDCNMLAREKVIAVLL